MSPLLTLSAVTYAPGPAQRATLGAKQPPILQNISLEIGERQCVALLGSNGAGKTSLLRCVLGLVDFQGDVCFEGKALADFNRRERAQRIAYVPQALDHIPAVSVQEFVAMGRYCHGDIGARVLQHPSVARAIKELDLESLRQRLLPSLSGGERQRCLIAAALAQDPSLLLLDEPTAFLDPGVREDILRQMARLPRERAMAVVFVTHDINAAAGHAERVIALKQGQIVFNGPARLLLSSGELGMIYSREFRLIADPQRDLPFVVAGNVH